MRSIYHWNGVIDGFCCSAVVPSIINMILDQSTWKLLRQRHKDASAVLGCNKVEMYETTWIIETNYLATIHCGLKYTKLGWTSSSLHVVLFN